MDIVTDLPESEGATMIFVVVNRFTTMTDCIANGKKNSPMVAQAYFENVCKYHGFPEDVVSDRDSPFTGQ